MVYVWILFSSKGAVVPPSEQDNCEQRQSNRNERFAEQISCIIGS